MHAPKPIQRQPNQEALLFQKSGPLLIQQGAVGLDGIVNGNTRRPVPPHCLRKIPEVGKPRNRRLSALKREAHHAVRVHGFKHLPDQQIGNFLFHDTHAVLCPVLRLVLIKAISTPQIAQTGSGFY